MLSMLIVAEEQFIAEYQPHEALSFDWNLYQ